MTFFCTRSLVHSITIIVGNFPHKLWNHYDTVALKLDKTTNRNEGNNFKMKKYCGAADPDMDKSVKQIKTFEVSARNKYENATKSNAKAAKQSIFDAKRETELCYARKLHQEHREGNNYK